VKDETQEPELDKTAYVGVDEMYQNAASPTEYPLATDGERERAAEAAGGLAKTEPDNAEVSAEGDGVEDEEDEDAEVEGTGEDPANPDGGDSAYASSVYANQDPANADAGSGSPDGEGKVAEVPIL